MTEAQAVLVDLPRDERAVARCAALLDGDERGRADRFMRAEDRIRFLGSHAALRVVLGRTLGTPPETVTIGRDADGRPILTGAGAGNVDFNLSHSGRYALIGLVRRGRIGVDVEVCRPLPDALRIARHHFASDEATALAALPAGSVQAAFFALWTRKEAVVKATGTGLSLPLAAFSVSVPPHPPRILRIDRGPRAWTLASPFDLTAAAVTVAVDRADARIVATRLPEGWADNFDAK